MPTILDYLVDNAPVPTGTGDWDDDLDACSILVPVDIVGTAGALDSVTSGGVELAEDPSDAWVSTETYIAGERVHLVSTHRVYEATGATGNTNKNPSLPVNQFNAAGVATFWIEVGPTNRTAMFDGLISSETVADSPLTFTLTPGAFNGFALFGIDADSYSVTVKDQPGGDVIYGEPITALEGSKPADYYEYFFDRFKPLKQFVRTGIEMYGDSEISITLSKSSGQVRLGMFAIGDMKPIGIPQRDAVVSPGGFTYFKQDAFGNATVKKRPNATSMSISCVMPIENANAVKADIDSISATPVVVVGSEAALYEWMTTFGLVTADITPVPYPDATIKLSVKGFI